MKMEVKCYKCGKRIFVHDYATTDICPECMSFIDVAQAKAALEEEEKALSAPVTDPTAQCEEPDETSTEIAAAAESVAEPEPCMQEQEEKWRGSWQKVLQKTKGLTDLSHFEYVRGDAKEAFQKMSAAERAQLYKAYGKTLAERRETLVNCVKAADREISYVESAGKETKKKHTWLWALIPILFVFIFVFVLFSSDQFMMNAAAGIIIFIILFAIVGIICSFIAHDYKKRQASQNSSFAAGANEERSYRYLSALERANIRKEIDNIDWLCGFLKF